MGELTLYALTDTLPALIDSLEGLEPGTPEHAECAAEIERYFEALPAKVDGVARFLSHLKAQAKHAADEVTRLQARKARFEAAHERLSGYVMRVLEQLPEPKRGNRKLDGITATLSLARCPASLRITDAARIPSEYITVIPASKQVCNSAVKDALKAGIEVPGAELITNKRLEVK